MSDARQTAKADKQRIVELEAERDRLLRENERLRIKCGSGEMLEGDYAALIEKEATFDPTPIDEEWLASIGFRRGSLSMNTLLAPVDIKAAPLKIDIYDEGEDGWGVSLTQGVPDDARRPDDHVVLTSVSFKARGQLIQLLSSLGVLDE